MTPVWTALALVCATCAPALQNPSFEELQPDGAPAGWGRVVWGVEGRVAVRDLGPFGARVSGTWQHVGRYTRQSPSAKLDFELSLAHAFGGHFLAGAVTGEWVHGLYMGNYGRDPMPDTFVMDLAVRYRYTPADRGWTVEPYVHLRNLLDRRYEYIRGYRMPGINVLAGLKIGLER